MNIHAYLAGYKAAAAHLDKTVQFSHHRMHYLLAVYQAGPDHLSVGAMQKLLEVNTGNISRMGHALMDYGLIEHFFMSEHPRKRFIKLTPKGLQIVDDFLFAYEEKDRENRTIALAS